MEVMLHVGMGAPVWHCGGCRACCKCAHVILTTRCGRASVACVQLAKLQQIGIAFQVGDGCIGKGERECVLQAGLLPPTAKPY
jgi:hypothetical protein